MKYFIILFYVINLNFALASTSVFGKGAPKTATISIPQLVKNPTDFVGKTVTLEGQVTEVCPMKGCWLNIKDEKTGEFIQVKVDDDVIVFPKTLVGKNLRVNGKVESLELSKAQAIKHFKHRAEELGKPFDENSVSGPTVIYQIRGFGAQTL